MRKTEVCCALAMVAAAPALGAVVYNARQASPQGILIVSEPDETSSFNEVAGSGRETDCRIGDAVTLSGTDRFVTEFSTRLWSFQTPASLITVDVELTIYQNVAGMPGAAIWTGSLPGVTLAGTTPVEITFNPNVTVPDSLCFALAYTNIIGTRTFGVVAAQAVSVGTSPLYTLRQDTASLAWRQDVGLNPGPDVFEHVDARITAVPAPGSLAPLAILTVAAFARRRKRG